MSNDILLDAVDRAIVEVLTHRGRLSNVDLASIVGLTPAPCLRRVKRLEDGGVITGYRAILNAEAVNRGFCVYMAVEITMTNRAVVDQLEKALMGYDEVTEVRRLYGAIDYLVRVDVADSAAYEKFQAEKVYPLAGIHRVVSHTTMKVIKDHG